jgi:hypothetical protein
MLLCVPPMEKLTNHALTLLYSVLDQYRAEERGDAET